jgi:hypothetical protein
MKKLKFSLLLASAAMAIAVLSGCGSKEESPAALETAREVANANSKFNATKWRGDNGFAEASILTRGDSTQQPKCPQGDGWASIDLLDPQTKKQVLALKCSTYSTNVGCVIDKDFKARPQLANQEGNCSTQVPYPFKKLEG